MKDTDKTTPRKDGEQNVGDMREKTQLEYAQEKQIEELTAQLNATEIKAKEFETQIESLKLEKEELTNALNYKNEQELNLETIAKSVEHFTYFDHTNRTASQVIRDLQK